MGKEENKNQYIPQIVFHPGVTLDEKLREINMSKKEFAVRVGKPEKTIFAILNETSRITPEMAILFEKVLKIPAHFWLNMQRRYDEFKARQENEEIIEKALEWAREFPYSEMARKGWVPEAVNLEEKTEALFSFFGISKHTAWESYYFEKQLKVSFRISLKHMKAPHAVSAWLRQGELQAGQLDVGRYDKNMFKNTLPEIKKIMAVQPEGFLEILQNLCIRAGVKLVYTPTVKKAPVNGSTRWLNENPLIQLSGRYKRNDIFWFTFFHEAGHILLHGKKDIFLEEVKYTDKNRLTEDIIRKEKEADDFAIDWTLSEKQEQEIVRHLPLSEDEIIEFARVFETHPALIIGRLQYKRLIPYSVGRGFIIPVDLEICD